MTLKQLEYFLAIAENGSITKAANSLRISQPPLSLQLKGLEEELGCQLFIRDKKNMIITPKGILLRERAREIMDKVNETLLLMQSANEEERYTIHLGTISSICNRVLPDKVLKLKERYPHVEFVLHEGSTTSILDMLADGTVDFGIVREPFNVGAYSSRPIRDTALGEGGQDYFTPPTIRRSWRSPVCRTPPSSSTGGTTIFSPTPAAARALSPTSSARTTTLPPR